MLCFIINKILQWENPLRHPSNVKVGTKQKGRLVNAWIATVDFPAGDGAGNDVEGLGEALRKHPFCV